ncbi:MAG: hypothetical protein IJS88_01450 [Alphaproteobacteria bacterium]|nr:hypothetical protein [Alphaproteobacteria bacterium]
MARKKKEKAEIRQLALIEAAKIAAVQQAQAQPAPVQETAPAAPVQETTPIQPTPVQAAPAAQIPSAPAVQLQVTPKVSSGLGFKWFALLMILVLLVGNVFSLYQLQQLEKRVSHDSNIYVYSMENVLLLAGMAEENKEYQIEFDKLAKDIDAAQKKLNSIKDKKLRQEYSEVYMKSLQLKRDTLVETHDKFKADLLKNINRALLAVTEKYNAPTIFYAKSIAVHTPNVVDVTDEISKYLKDTM